MWSEHRFIAADKTPLFFRRLRPSGGLKATVLLTHGMGEHSGRYAEFAEHLASKGFAVYLPDLRGFGQSGGKRGCLRRFEDYFSDLDGVGRLAAAWESRPLFFMGHSYGGLITAAYLAENPGSGAKGMVLSSPNFGIAIRVPLWRHALALAVHGLFPDTVQGNRVDRRTLTHDIPHLQKHAEDPLIHDRISARLYIELVSRIRRAREIASNITLPSLVLQAGDDRVVSRQATEGFYSALASSDKRLKIYEGLYHEVLNETSRREVYEEVASWLSQRA